jgi:hypothetical protein
VNNVGGSGDRGVALQSIGSAGVEQREPTWVACGGQNEPLAGACPSAQSRRSRRSGRTPGAAFSFAELPGPFEAH